MIRFYSTLFACLIMMVLLPYADVMAVSQSSPVYTHYIYMFAHAGWLHLAINAWTLLVLHNLFTWYRLLASYICAVLISLFLLPDLPMVGASVISCFFLGFIMPHTWRRSRLTILLTLSLLLFTCLLPGMAGLPHVASYIVGLLFVYAEGFVRDLKRYTS